MIDLQGHTALVTGSTQGIGAAIAKAIARAGGNVVLHGLEKTKNAAIVQEECESFGVRTALIEGDLAGPVAECVDRVFHAAIGQMPDIDLLVSNAGTYDDVSFLQMTEASFERTMRLNVASHFFLVQRFARRWHDRGIDGRIVLTGSINGRLAEPNHAAYDTSKGAVDAMVRTLCVELAPLGMRINGLAPGLFQTPLTQPALADRKTLTWMQWHTPNGSVPGPEVVGPAAVFLLSDAADHVHGHMLIVDGGMSAWQQPDAPPNWCPPD